MGRIDDETRAFLMDPFVIITDELIENMICEARIRSSGIARLDDKQIQSINAEQVDGEQFAAHLEAVDVTQTFSQTALDEYRTELNNLRANKYGR